MQEKHNREAAEDAERLAKELAQAIKQQLIPIRKIEQIGEFTWAITEGHRSDGFVLGGGGIDTLALNPHRPKCRIKMYSVVDTTKQHSSGKKGSWRRWQVVKPGPTAKLPAGLELPLTAVWVVLHVSLCLDEQQEAIGEPEIYIAPWQRITKARNKVVPFIVAVGPQDIASSENHVLPCRKRDTHINGYLSKVFAEFFDLHKIDLMQKYFPVIVAKRPETPAAAPIDQKLTPHPPPSTTKPPARPPSFTQSKTAASRTGLRQARQLTKIQQEKIDSVDVLEKELGEARDEIRELNQIVADYKSAEKQRESRKRKRPKADRKERQYISKDYAEGMLRDYYANNPKVVLISFILISF